MHYSLYELYLMGVILFGFMFLCMETENLFNLLMLPFLWPIWVPVFLLMASYYYSLELTRFVLKTKS